MSVASVFKEVGCDWCFLREPDVVEKDSVGGKDLDIWCELDHCGSVVRSLGRYGWQIEGGRCVGSQSSGWFNIVIRFSHPDSRVPLEVFFGDLRWGVMFYLKEECVKADIRFVREVPYVTETSLLHILITRVVLRGSLEGERLARARVAWVDAKVRARTQWLEYFAKLLGEKIADQVVDVLENKARRLSTSRTGVVLSLWRGQLALLPRLAVKALGYGVNWFRNAVSRGRYWICMLGTDGAGKTTLTHKVSTMLDGNVGPVRIFYWGRAKGNTRLVSYVRTLFLKNVGEGQKSKKIQQGSVYRLAGFIYYAEYYVRFLFEVLIQRFRNRDVLTDRGVYDLLVMTQSTRILRWLVLHFPKPDMLLFCDAPVDVIYARKQERTPDVLKWQQSQYQAVIDTIDGQLLSTRLDTTRDISETLELIATYIRWVRLAKKNKLDWAIMKHICAN